MAKMMTKSTRRPQQVFSIVMWILSLVFAGFLIGLGSLIIRDIPSVDRSITIESFVDMDQMETLNQREAELRSGLLPLRREVEDARNVEAAARSDYRSRREAFDNWIATRNATQAADTNPDVIARTQDLEQLTEQVRDAERNTEILQQSLILKERTNRDIQAEMRGLNDAAQPAYRAAVRAQELRVFGFRLLLTLPLLALAAWMIARKRNSAYWPLYRGFVIFSLFAFFVELVPYLPSYGGYVRYVVGIGLVMVAGGFLIRRMRIYLARKQADEARSEAERRQSIDYETALKKIAAKTCPGCDRSIMSRDGVHSDFCVHCGIHLQRECPVCDTRNVTFYRFCLSCGTANADVPEAQAPPGAIPG